MSTNKRNWGEYLSLAKFCYNFRMHSVIKMSPFELTLGKEAKKQMDLAIPMGQRDHFKEAMEMVKGHEELCDQAKKF